MGYIQLETDENGFPINLCPIVLEHIVEEICKSLTFERIYFVRIPSEDNDLKIRWKSKGRKVPEIGVCRDIRHLSELLASGESFRLKVYSDDLPVSYYSIYYCKGQSIWC